MIIKLAGMNIDIEFINTLKQGIKDGTIKIDGITNPDAVTPETIAAAYARISRKQDAVDQIRKESMRDVEKARDSNQNIAFTMGHQSIAEHAVFNVDILGISRFLTEAVQWHRLNAYTEKSQRYVLFTDDYIIPREIKGTELEQIFIQTAKELFRFYFILFEKLKPYMFETHKPDMNDKARVGQVEGCAKEDARYIIPIATQTQFGATINGRTLELMIRDFLNHPTAEGREIGQKLVEITQGIAPSLVKYILYDTGKYFSETPTLIKEAAKSFNINGGNLFEEVKLINTTEKGEDQILASIAWAIKTGSSYQDCLDWADKAPESEKIALLKAAIALRDKWDNVLRQFENADAFFELVISSSCFGQLKRHRMCTQIIQDYDTNLGVTVPESIKAIGVQQAFMDQVSKAEAAYQKLYAYSLVAAPYILTNAHRRRVLVKMNIREMFHFCKERCSEHAQWDIRRIAGIMLDKIRTEYPLISQLICGKDQWETVKNEFLSK